MIEQGDLFGDRSISSWMPEPGHMAVGQLGHDRVFILPSIHEHYYHVAYLFVERKDGPAFAQSTKRPIHRDAVQTVIQIYGITSPECMSWEAWPCDPQEKNLL